MEYRITKKNFSGNGNQDQNTPQSEAGWQPRFASVSATAHPGTIRYDGALHIQGNAMYPRLMNGDIILYKIVPKRHHSLFFGHICLLIFEQGNEEYIAVRYIHPSENSSQVKLVSHNQEHPPHEIPVDCIRTMAVVKTSIRHETF